ncbi:MAG TPA: hypothetical protein VLC93_10490 [Myxococcota bacterium]|nr:hypothetical protein [Myxococcota bacterium]
MTVESPKRLSVVVNRGGGRPSGSAMVSGATARDPGQAVSLTLERKNATLATLTGGVSKWDNGRTALTMTRAGRATDIVGTIGFEPGFKQVSLRVEQESFAKTTVKGLLCNRDVNLTIERSAGLTTVTGKLGAYEQSAIGSVAITIRDSGDTRIIEGSTSRESEGRVKLEQVREGDTTKTTGKLGGWDVTELSQPANMRDLELFDTTLLIVLTQAVRRWMQKI